MLVKSFLVGFVIIIQIIIVVVNNEEDEEEEEEEDGSWGGGEIKADFEFCHANAHACSPALRMRVT